MIKRAVIPAVILLLAVLSNPESVFAEQSQCTGPTADAYLACAKKCEKSFYFSEQSESPFAQLRSACIEGCGYVDDAQMPAYERCHGGCRETFPYRHGINRDFAEIQKTCIVGCRRVR